MRAPLLSIAFLALASPAIACGQRVHVEMARRAVDRFLAEAGPILPGIDPSSPNHSR